MPGSWGPCIEMGFMFQSRRGVQAIALKYIACILGLSHKDLLSFCTSNKNKKIDVMFMKFYPNHQFKIISCVLGGFNGLIQ